MVSDLCVNCEEDMSVSGTIIVKNNSYCSEKCVIEDGNFECDECKEFIGNGDEIDADDKHFCNESCANSHGLYKCNSCEEFVEESSDSTVNIKNLYYCDDDCAENDGYVKCDSCKTYISESGAKHFESNGTYYCDDECAKKEDVHECQHCNEYKFKSDLAEVSEDELYCVDDCVHEARYHRCEDCSNWVSLDSTDALWFKESLYCNEDCANATQCDDCGDYVSKNDSVEADNRHFCNVECAINSDYSICNNCNDLKKYKEGIEVNGDFYCDTDCGDAVECEECESYVKNSDALEIKSDAVYHFCDEDCAKDSNKFIECENCDELTPNGNILCEECRVNCFKCDGCNHMSDIADRLIIGSESYCSYDCASNNDYEPCDRCTKYFDIVNMIEVGNTKRFYCNGCKKDKNVIHCDACSVGFFGSSGVDARGYHYCSKECSEIVTCDFCGREHNINNVHVSKDGKRKACHSCYEKGTKPKEEEVKNVSKQQRLLLEPYTKFNYIDKLLVNDVYYFGNAYKSKDKEVVNRAKNIAERSKEILSANYQLDGYILPAYAVLGMSRYEHKSQDILYFKRNDTTVLISKTSIVETRKDSTEVIELFNFAKDGNLNRLEQLAKQCVQFQLIYATLNRTYSISNIVNNVIKSRRKSR